MLGDMETTTAIDHFAGKLAYETDVSDVRAALSGEWCVVTARA